MIVKYFNNGVWGYIDNVRQASSMDIDCAEMISKYNNCEEYQDKTHSGENDIASYSMDEKPEKLPPSIAASNKVYLMATENQSDWGHNVHTENLIDGEMAISNYPAAVVLLYVEEHKEYDSIALVTNQKCFLMNDKGQTIERLV